MAVRTVITQTCDVCGDKISDVQAKDAASVPNRGIRVQAIKVTTNGETTSELYAFEEICDKCLGAVNALFARLGKRNKARVEKLVKAKRAAKADKAASAPAVTADGEPKKKRGRPKKVVAEAVPNTAPIDDSAPVVAAPEEASEAAEPHVANGAAPAEASHPF